MAKSIILPILFGLLQLGCGDRAGDPVVALTARQEPTNNDPDSGPDGPGPSPVTGPGGLCAPCNRGEDCGDENDLCLSNRRDDPGYCGRSCQENRDCPDRYRCQPIQRSDEHQCVPETNDCSHVVEHSEPLSVMRAEALVELNALRAEAFLPAFTADACLDGLAEQSAAELSLTGDTLGKFERECEPVKPDCDCGWSAQNEISIARFGLTWQEAVESSTRDRWRNDSNDSFVRNITEPENTRVGFGIVISGDEAWTAISYGR